MCGIHGRLPFACSSADQSIGLSKPMLRVRFHDLRHSCANLMLKQGVHPKIVSEMPGHSTAAITLDVYSHVTPGLQEGAAKKLDEILP